MLSVHNRLEPIRYLRHLEFSAPLGSRWCVLRTHISTIRTFFGTLKSLLLGWNNNSYTPHVSGRTNPSLRRSRNPVEVVGFLGVSIPMVRGSVLVAEIEYMVLTHNTMKTYSNTNQGSCKVLSPVKTVFQNFNS